MSTNDQFLKNAVDEDIQQIAIPDGFKEQVWQDIERNINKNQPRKWRYPLAGVAAAVLLMGIILSAPGGGTASFFMKWIQYSDGESNQLMAGKKTHSPTDPKTPPPPDDAPSEVPTVEILEDQRVQKAESKGLKEAQQMAKFTIRVPSFVPKGYEFAFANVFYYEGEKSDQVVLRYDKAEKSILIEQRYFENDFGMGMGFGDAYMETANVNGNDAQVVIFRDKSVKIMWLDEKVFITVQGTEDKDELLEMARSISE